MPGPKPRLHLPLKDWPLADRLLWQRGFSDDHDPFAEATGAHLAKASQERCLCAWRRFLGFLTDRDPIALEVAPVARLTIERLRPFVSHLAETNAPTSVASITEALYEAARFMMPESDWTWLKNVKSRLHAAAPARSPTGPVITSVQLLDLGQRLMDEVEASLKTSFDIHKAVQYRDGLIVALLAFVPIRPRNLIALVIGRQMVLEGERWFIIIPGEETKTGTDIEFSLPEILVPYFATYLEVVRPRIIRRAPCASLWVSHMGGALSYVGLVKVFQRLSSRLGIRISPHDARDAAATTWAISAPDQIGVARDLLTHSDLRTTNKHYNRARGIEASRAYRQVIAGIRGKKHWRGS
jgi:integrase/recombinase XerD